LSMNWLMSGAHPLADRDDSLIKHSPRSGMIPCR